MPYGKVGQRFQISALFFGASMDLDYVQLIFTLRLERNPTDRFVLFGIKPSFEKAFREGAVDVSTRGTSAREGIWQQLFSQALSPDEAALKRFQKPALPFVFQLPVLQPPNKGELVEIGLVLLGRATQFLPQFIHALELMLQDPTLQDKVQLSLFKVETASYAGSRHLLMGKDKKLDTGFMDSLSLSLLTEQQVASDNLSIRFITPLRLMVEGRPLREFSVSPFLRALLRRVSSTVYYSGGLELGHDFKWLAQQSRMVRCCSEDFRWTMWGSRWSGFTGRITLSGELAELHQFLLAGALLGVGKGATYGLGRYFVEASPGSS